MVASGGTGAGQEGQGRDGGGAGGTGAGQGRGGGGAGGTGVSQECIRTQGRYLYCS